MILVQRDYWSITYMILPCLHLSFFSTYTNVGLKLKHFLLYALFCNIYNFGFRLLKQIRLIFHEFENKIIKCIKFTFFPWKQMTIFLLYCFDENFQALEKIIYFSWCVFALSFELQTMFYLLSRKLCFDIPQFCAQKIASYNFSIVFCLFHVFYH